MSDQSRLLEPLLVETHSQNNTKEFIDRINSKNVKSFAVGLIFFFILYHSSVHVIYGKDSCRWLFSDGFSLSDITWQPYDCMMHLSSEVDRSDCVKYLVYWGQSNKFVFVGDGRIRNMYWTLEKEFHDLNKSILDNSSLEIKDQLSELNMDFVWAPYVSTEMINEFKKWTDGNGPSIIVAGCALWSIKDSNASESALDDYSKNLTLLLPWCKELCKINTKILWDLQPPVDENKLNTSYEMISNDMIDKYNQIAAHVFGNSCVEVWSSSKVVEGLSTNKQLIDEFNSYSNVNVELSLDMYCNDIVNRNSSSCCKTGEKHSYAQMVTFIFLAISVLCCLAMVMWPVRFYMTRNSTFKIVMTSFGKMALIMAYFYICDGTRFFMKANKHFSNVTFWFPLIYILIIALFFTEESRYTKILHRDQTDEWKGWMQVVILIYEVTGVSSNSAIAAYVSFMASTYLFLSGFGHFTYMATRTDAGFVRFLQVLFRLNFFTVMLCLCMNRPYGYYYFVPIVTFWFVVLYLILWLPPKSLSSRDNYVKGFLLFLKLTLLLLLIALIYKYQWFFEKIVASKPLSSLITKSEGNVKDWWYRWDIDRYSVFLGAVFGLILLMNQWWNFLDDNHRDNLLSPRLLMTTSAIAIIGIIATSVYVVYFAHTWIFLNFHSFIVLIPILCYMILRNVSGIIRTRYSTVFSFFGNISLELFVSHFHIWLTEDTKGVLVLIPYFTVFNFIITSFILVCISHEVHCITEKLTPHAIPSDWKCLMRNLVIFAFIGLLLSVKLTIQ